MVELPGAVRRFFVEAGWYPGRSVPVPTSVPRDHPAWEVLSALGGLTILRRYGPEWPPIEELEFGPLDPCPDITGVWGGLLGSRLVGIAEVHNAHGELYLAADGRCFGSSRVHDAFYFEGESFAEAVEARLLGRWARPMLRPGQEYVTLYGERFTADSLELYRYK